MANRRHIFSIGILGLLLHVAPAGADPDVRSPRIEDIDEKRTTIVVNDIAYSLAPNVAVRDVEGKPVSRSALRKGVRFSATSQRVPGNRQFVITEIQLLGADEQK